MLDSFLRQVTKDSYGPVSFIEKTKIPVIVHRFSDAYSVLGWGKMPEPITDWGRLSSLIFASLNQRFRSPESWKTFLRSPEALSFRKAGSSIPQSGSVSSMLNEISDRLPFSSNFLGVMNETGFKALDSKMPITSAHLLGSDDWTAILGNRGMVFPVVEYFQEEKVPVSTVMGRTVWDPSVWRNLPFPKMLPFELHCHFALNEATAGSLRYDSISIPKTASRQTLQPGTQWDFPIIELVVPQDPFRRKVGLSEALWMTGVAPDRLQSILLSAAWPAAWMRSEARRSGLNLESMQLRFAMHADGSLTLVDGFLPEDLHFEKNGVRYSFETAVGHYRKTSWFDSVEKARAQAEQAGAADWRRLCVEPIPFLDPRVKTQVEAECAELASLLLGKSGDVLSN